MKFTNSITVSAESSYLSNNVNNNNNYVKKLKKTIRKSTPVGHIPYEGNFKDFLNAEKVEFYNNNLNEPSFYNDESTEENEEGDFNNKYIAPKLSTDFNF